MDIRLLLMVLLSRVDHSEILFSLIQVLKDVGELINLTINQARNRQPLSGSTTFNRIDVSSSPDPLNGD